MTITKTSNYHGVYWLAAENAWCCLGFRGLFADEEEAAVYFDVWNIWGKQEYPANFPEIVKIWYEEVMGAASTYCGKPLHY
jgi:hypothetical protein